jgi:hypothetical protein
MRSKQSSAHFLAPSLDAKRDLDAGLPNVRFSADETMVFFTSNLFGASYVFGVEVKKAENPAAADVKDTAELGRQ